MNKKEIALVQEMKTQGIAALPFYLVEKSILELETMLFSIFSENFSADESRRLIEAYRDAKEAHEKTGAVRKGSGIPYIQHPLGVTIFAWHLAHMMDFKGVDKFNLLVTAISHDTVEDTEIFGTKDTGVQLSEFAKKYSEKLAIILIYLTKIPLNIESGFKKLRNHFKRNHLIIFENDFIPIESRLIKTSDRILNTADMKHSSKEFADETLYYTEKHFEPVLRSLPHNIKFVYYRHIDRVKNNFNLE